MKQNPALTLDGVHNFRDYGGYGVIGGGRIKSDMLFRSGQHHGATDGDLAAIAALNLRSVIDFRGNRERESQPCRRPVDFTAEIIFYDGETAALAPHEGAAQGVLNAADAHRKMEQLYSTLPFRKPLIAMLRRYFAVLAQGNGPSLVHCLAGKDRTGMAAALLHHALGVHPDDAMADFLLTNTIGNAGARIAAGGDAIRARWGGIDDAAIQIMMGVDETYLLAARKAVETEHGSLDAFLADVLG